VTRGTSRKRLIEVTARLLREQGYAATTVTQILDQSKIQRSSLYYLFPDGKAELAAAAVSEHRRQLVQGLNHLHTRYPYAREGIAALFHFFAKELQDSDYTRGSALSHMTVGSVDEKVRLEVSKGYLHLKESLQVWLTRSGLPTATASARAELALTLLEGALVLCQAHHSCEPLRQALRQLEELTPVSSPSEPG